MWISRKEYKFLKENAEKNIDKECEILKNRVNELTKIIDGQKTNDNKIYNKIYVIVDHNYTLGDFVLSKPVAYAIDEQAADKWISDQRVKTYRGNDGNWYPYYTKEIIDTV